MEKLFNRAMREDKVQAHRFVYSFLFSTKAQWMLFNEYIPRVKQLEMNYGYTRVQQLGRRKNDSAEMAEVQLIPGEQYLNEMELIQDWHENDYVDTYWKYELRKLREEQEYFKMHLD